MTRIALNLGIWLLTFLCLASLLSTAQAATPTKPNILFIYADDQSYKTLGCYPEAPKWVRTPNLDALAKSGVRFHRAYLGTWCMPSRASLLTGKLPIGIESMRMEGKYPGSTYDPKKTPFVPAVFRQQGYQTAQIGKWHTGTDTGFGRDWDYQIVWNRPGQPDNAGAYYTEQLLTFNGETRSVPGYSTDNYTNWAVDYIEGKQRVKEKPWYLWLCYGAVHGPTTPAPRHKGFYKGKEAPIPADIVGPRSGKPAYLDTTQKWTKTADGKVVMKKTVKREGNFDKDEPGLDYHAWIQQVNECTLALDEAVGKLLTALKKSGQLENTLVVYTADQGFALGEHGLHQKLAPYDASFASPLIISQPGTIPSGKFCPHAVSSPDLVATFCARAGVKLPWATQGRDISPLLQNPETDAWQTSVLMTHTGQKFGSDTRTIPTGKELTEQGNTPWWVMLREGHYKYIRYLQADETEELYDLSKDPEELKNLVADPEQQGRLTSLQKKLKESLTAHQAGFVENMPKTKK